MPGKDIVEAQESGTIIPFLIERETVLSIQHSNVAQKKWEAKQGTTRRIPLVLMPRDDRNECRVGGGLQCYGYDMLSHM